MAKTAVIVVGVIRMIMMVMPGFGSGDLPEPKRARLRMNSSIYTMTH